MLRPAEWPHRASRTDAAELPAAGVLPSPKPSPSDAPLLIALLYLLGLWSEAFDDFSLVFFRAFRLLHPGVLRLRACVDALLLRA